MRILIISPSLEPYGGVRVILNWAKYLSHAGHEVTLNTVNGWMSTPWFRIPDAVQVRHGWPHDVGRFDCVISTNPDTTHFLWDKPAPRRFYLMQMAEELFNPTAEDYAARCVLAAQCPFPIITVAEWITQWYADVRIGPMYVVPNGIDDEFQPDRKVNTRKIIIVEGWEVNNQAKDVNNVAHRAIERIREKYDVTVVGYGQQPLETDDHLIDEYWQTPSTRELAKLYNAADLFVKASKYETRSLAPLEAMACGTIPVVACVQGHPDIHHGYNGFRSAYDADDLTRMIEAALTTDRRETMRFNGLAYREERLHWSKIINYYINPLLNEVS